MAGRQRTARRCWPTWQTPDPSQTDQYDGCQSKGSENVRRAVDYQIQTGYDSFASCCFQLPEGQASRCRAVSRDRSEDRRPSGRLLPDSEDRFSLGGCCRDVLHRTGRLQRKPTRRRRKWLKKPKTRRSRSGAKKAAEPVEAAAETVATDTEAPAEEVKKAPAKKAAAKSPLLKSGGRGSCRRKRLNKTLLPYEERGFQESRSCFMPVRLPKCGGIRAVRPDDVRGGRLLRAEYLTARFPEDAGPFVLRRRECGSRHGRDSDVRFPEGNPGFYGAVCEGKSRWRSIPAKRAPTGRRAKKDFYDAGLSHGLFRICAGPEAEY